MRKGNKLINDGKVPKGDFNEGLKDGLRAFYLDGVEAGYEAGYEEGEKCQDEVMFDKGMNVAWEIARKIIEYNESECEQVFGTVLWSHIICCLSASEAKEKIEAWEKKQQEADVIRVGDEVVDDDAELTFIVTRLRELPEFEGICSDGACYPEYPLDRVRKTGRSFTSDLSNLLSMIGKEK